MKTEIRRNLVVICISTSLFAPWRATSLGHREYRNADGFSVVILPVGRQTGHNESKIEFYSPVHQRLCTLDYSSEDGQHGFGVAKAAWTPDGEFFVFSMSNSGGHQPWHAPTLFFSVTSRAVFSLDNYVKGSGISTAEFILKAPNTVVTESWRNQTAVPVSFHLGELATNARGSRRPLKCFDGKIMKPGA